LESLSEATRSFIRAMPKAELHIHLEGSVDPATLLELARRRDRLSLLPSAEPEALQQWFSFVDFPHFIQVYLTISDLLRTAEDFALIAYRCGQDMAAQGIRYREITVTPFTHIDYQRKGLSIEALLEGLQAGRTAARADFGVEMRWIFDVPRNLSFPPTGGYDPHPAERTLEYALAGRDAGVIGFGLGGNEVGAPPEPFAHAFARAHAEGLLCAPHAGETEGPASVWGAIEALRAHRIGHGVRSIEDPRLVDVLRERQIPLEVNIISNLQLHIYNRVEEHPFPQLDRMGVKVTVNSDDPPLFNTTLCTEYEVVASAFGYSHKELMRIARNAFEVSAAPPALKAQWLAEFDAWAAVHE
jgi:aminodeoxyfutalosine deaminase